MRTSTWLRKLKKTLENWYRTIFGKFKRSSRPARPPRSPSHPHHVHYGKNITIEKSIFNSVNNIRKRKNLPMLTWNDELYATGQTRAKEISHNFSHAGCPSGCGENIAQIPIGNVRGLGFVHQHNIPQKFVSTWMHSPGHRDNILRSSYHSGVIGVYQIGRNYYAVQLFS